MCFHHLHKKIFSLALILCLTIPANAAVSVSDGSAFVSKSEFATDINNLSNRMAQLENSLDAKIDSLVSSYLSRNGIWNGEKQTIVTSSQRGNLIGGTTALLNNYYSGTNTMSADCPFFKDCISINKSGLAFITFTLVGSSSYNEFSINAHTWANLSTYNGISAVYTLGFYTSSSGSSSNMITSVSASAGSSSNGFYAAYSSVSNSTAIRFYLPATWGKHTLIGFVQKGDYISFASALYASAAYYGANLSVSGEGTYLFTINDCIVY